MTGGRLLWQASMAGGRLVWLAAGWCGWRQADVTARGLYGWLSVAGGRVAVAWGRLLWLAAGWCGWRQAGVAGDRLL